MDASTVRCSTYVAPRTLHDGVLCVGNELQVSAGLFKVLKESNSLDDGAFFHIDLEHLVLTSCHQYLPCALGSKVHAPQLVEFGVSGKRWLARRCEHVIPLGRTSNAIVSALDGRRSARFAWIQRALLYR